MNKTGVLIRKTLGVCVHRGKARGRHSREMAVCEPRGPHQKPTLLAP